MRGQERAQGRQVPGCHPPQQVGILQDLLDHDRVDVDQARLDQVQAEEAHFLVLPAIGGQLSLAPKEDQVVGRVPALHHVQTLVHLSAQFLGPSAASPFPPVRSSTIPAPGPAIPDRSESFPAAIRTAACHSAPFVTIRWWLAAGADSPLL